MSDTPPEIAQKKAKLQALNRLGTQLMRQGKTTEAIQVFDQAIRWMPSAPSSYFNRGNAYLHAGQNKDAVACYIEAMKIDPAYVRPLVNLGVALIALHRFEEAEARLREAVKREPSLALAKHHLANALASQAKHQEAIQWFERVLQDNPNDSDCRLNLVASLAECGEMGRAAKLCQQVIDREPENTRAFSWMTRLDPDSVSADDIRRMQNYVVRAEGTVKDMRVANFALGRVLDGSKQFDEAFAHFAAGNRLKKSQHDPDEHERLCDRLIEVFSAETFEKHRGFGVSDDRFVFIVGMPRTGTTLNEQILSSHSQITGVGELDEVRKITEESARKCGVGYPESVLNLSASEIERFAHQYIRRIDSLAEDSPRIIDKMPTNFLHLGIIALMFPRATLLHCRRHPIDTCLSCFFQSFQLVHYSFDLEHVGRFYRQYERLMAHWRSVLPLPIFDIVYEDLVADQESVTRKTLEFCNLPWDENCLQFHRNEKTVRTSSLHQVRKPLYKSSVERWRSYEKHLGPLFKSLHWRENQ